MTIAPGQDILAADVKIATPATAFSGVDPTGTTDSTAGLQAWLSSGTDLYLPPGRYLTRPISLSGVNGLKITGGGSNLQTAAGRPGTFLILTQASSTLLTLTGCSSTIRDVTFLSNGPLRSLAGAVGVRYNGNSGNSLMERCAVIGFASGGVFDQNPSSGAGGSSDRFDGCYILYNGNVQMLLQYASDYMITDCQIGGDTAGVPVYGLQLDHASNGAVMGTDIWSNGIAMIATNSHYLRIIGNRFEMSNTQGSYIDTCNGLVYVGNWLNNNSLGGSGTSDNAYFNNCTDGTVAGNVSYDWSGNNLHRYGFFFDAGCARMQIGQNQDQFSSQGPVFINNPAQLLSDSLITAGRAFNNAVGLSSGSAATVLSVSLTAGLWEVNGNFAFNVPASLSSIQGFLSGPGLVGPAQGATVALYASQLTGSGENPSLAIGPAIVNITGTGGTVLLQAEAIFSGSCSAYGYLQAKRLV